VFIREQLTCD